MTLDDEKRQAHAKVYSVVVESYVHGFLRIVFARMSHLTMRLAIVHYNRTIETSPAPGILEDVRRELGSISHRGYDSWNYVSDFGQLIYAAAVLDTFLTDTTRFIFLVFPESIGKSQGATVQDIVNANSTADLLRAAVEKRARELSYSSFIDRIKYLERNYGLSLQLQEDVLNRLVHFAGVRNVIVHDQGHFDFVPTLAGGIEVKHKTCPVHPTPVSGDDIVGAVRAFSAVVCAISKSVFRDVLRVEIPSALKYSLPVQTATAGRSNNSGLRGQRERHPAI